MNSKARVYPFLRYFSPVPRKTLYAYEHYSQDDSSVNGSNAGGANIPHPLTTSTPPPPISAADKALVPPPPTNNDSCVVWPLPPRPLTNQNSINHVITNQPQDQPQSRSVSPSPVVPQLELPRDEDTPSPSMQTARPGLEPVSAEE